uniref:cytochrome c oxidase subunit 3 n=1 Tax=Magnusiomyces suaveolens TaxID=44074 RepID=UPI001BEE30AF|nr:cytochrome c oxidase subunit 3 [Saprochaete suaveolens]QUV75108.1 cytochrome c oxidase subunit 3 [Saprochaete suaveolens]
MLNINRQAYQAHPYHTVENSPWPFFVSFSTFGTAMNTATTMHGYIGSSIWVITGIVCTVYSMSTWFRDVIAEGTYTGHHTLAVRNGINTGFTTFILSEATFFLGIFWSFGHSAISPTVETGAMWPPMGIEAIQATDTPTTNTITTTSSGATTTYSHHYTINGNRKQATTGTVFTTILAGSFTICQYIEYRTATFTITDGVFGSVFYMGTGFHGIHVIVGGIMLSIALWRIYSYHSTNTHHTGYHTSALYWHFVDVVWTFTFVVFYWYGS